MVRAFDLIRAGRVALAAAALLLPAVDAAAAEELDRLVRGIRDSERAVRAALAANDRGALAAPRAALLANHKRIMAATKPGDPARILCGTANQTLLNVIYDLDLPPPRDRAAITADDHEYRRQMTDCERAVGAPRAAR